MSNYTRLTDRRLLNGFYQPHNQEERRELIKMAALDAKDIYEKLGELENDMESGRLVYLQSADIVEDGCMERCSSCGESIEFPHWAFCPKCGSKLNRR